MSTSPDARAQRIAARGEQERLNAAARVQLERDRLNLDRQKQIAREQTKRERKHTRAQAWAKRRTAVRKALPTIGRRVMITGPISAPMTVAWIGQIQFALDVLGWILIGAVVFAASWELTTAFAGWMYHQARKDGDRGTIFRVATWLFAASAGAMNYWHALDGQPVTHPTPKAVSYGAMSLVGIGLWELYASLIHRKELRDRGLMPQPRPRFGLVKWLRYFPTTYTAWSLAILRGFESTEQAWVAAVAARAEKKALKGQEKNGSGMASPVHVTAVIASAGLRSWAVTSWTRPPIFWTPTISGPRVAPAVKEIEPNPVQVPAVTAGASTRAESLDGSETPAKSGSRTRVHDSGSGTSGTREAKEQRTRAKKKTGTGPLERLSEARAVNKAHLAEHGKPISAEKLRQALGIRKATALELIKEIRGARMDVAK